MFIVVYGVIILFECEFFVLCGVVLFIEIIDKVCDCFNFLIMMDGLLVIMYDLCMLYLCEVLECVVEVFGDDVLEIVIGCIVKFLDVFVLGVLIIEFVFEYVVV